MSKILVAGMGNVSHGDEGFGCEVLSKLKRKPFPEEVTLTDFGVRSFELAHALTDGYDATILVDAVPRRKWPGTVYLMEPDLEHLERLQGSIGEGNSLSPVSVLKMAQSMGNIHGRVFLVGCEPAVLESEKGRAALSEKVRSAIPQAIELIETLLEDLTDKRHPAEAQSN